MTTTGATNTRRGWVKSEQALIEVGAVFGPRADIPQRCLHECVERYAASTPHAPAILFEGEDSQVVSLSYGSLNWRANALAHALETVWGVGPGNLIGVCLEPSLEGVVAFLALGKVGAAPYFLDPESPLQRLVFLLADAGCQLLLTRASSRGPSSLTHAALLRAGWRGGSVLALA